MRNRFSKEIGEEKNESKVLSFLSKVIMKIEIKIPYAKERT